MGSNPPPKNNLADKFTSAKKSIVDDHSLVENSELTEKKIDQEVRTAYVDTEFKLIDIYNILVDTRKFEIENFWKRAIFFWGTIALLFAGYFTLKKVDDYMIFISYLGFFYNLIFSLSIRGSKYWQEHWEHVVQHYEKSKGIQIFHWKSKEQIKSDNEKVFKLLRPYKFSVSKLTMILCDITLLFWALLIIKDFTYLITKNKIQLAISLNNDFDFYTFIIIIIPLICAIYLFIFIRTEKKRM